MSTQVQPLSLDALNVRGDEVRYDVAPEAIRAYAEATDDPSPAALEGRIATPVFAIVPLWEAISPVSKAVASDEARKRVVHFSQDMLLILPAKPKNWPQSKMQLGSDERYEICRQSEKA